MKNFDYIILSFYLAAVFIAGLYFRNRNQKSDDLFLAGRRMGWFPIGLSVMVTSFSAINYLSLPNEVFGHGLYVIMALPVFFLVALPVTKIWMPFFFHMRLTSAYEYLELRFDKRVRSLASGLFILWRLFWMGTALYASGQIMTVLTGIPAVLIILAGGIIATGYTFTGGMRAVMWTDVLQFFVLFGGIVLGVIHASGNGGLGEILSLASQGGRLKPLIPFDASILSFDPRLRMTLWSSIIGVSVAFLARYGADQVVMQRYFSARTLRMAQKGLWLNAVAAFVSLSLLALLGLAVYASAVKTGALAGTNLDSLTPAALKGIAMRELAGVIKAFPSGVTGLITAGLMAATMSSIDSGINACSASYITDLHSGLFGRSGNLRLGRILTGGFGILATGMALMLIPLAGGTSSLFMIVNKLINGLGSPLLALFLLGMFTKRANATGMFYGGIIGLLASISVSLFLKSLALQYYAVVNLLVTVTPCLIISLISSYGETGQNPDKLRWTWFAWRNRSE